MKIGKKLFVAFAMLALISSAWAGGKKDAGASSAAFKAGTYSATTDGRNGPIEVSVTFTADAIKSVKIGKNTESVGIATPALERLPENIVKHQSIGVDAISGATITSEAILAAVAECITKAGANPNDWKKGVVLTAGADIDRTADVIVVGGGGAGLAAAIAAREANVSVILIEKTDVLGGNTILSGGKWNAADPEMQGRTPTIGGQIATLQAYLTKDEKDYPAGYAETLTKLKGQIRNYLAGDTKNMFDSVELHIIQCYEGGLRQDLDGNWIYGDYELVKNFCEQSLDALHWIQKNWDMKWQDNVTTVYGGLWRRGHSPIDEAAHGAGYFESGKIYADKLGVEFMMNTAAKSIIMNNGKAVGINAQMKDGTKVTLHANKGVVIATGGYGGSVELVKQYNNFWPALPREITTNNAAGVTGDGIFMCRDVNADLVGMGFVQLMALSHPVTNGNTGLNSNPEQILYVNKEGVRFVNEYAARDVIAAAAFAQTDGMFYSIDDIDTAHIRYKDAQLKGWVDQGYVWTADTIEELAKKINIDPSVLVKSVNTYNSYVKAGKDPDFGKNVMEATITKGPFYATPHKPNIHHTMGGVRINTKTQVIDTNGNPIPGLYAAGEVCGGIHAGNRLGGNATADAFTHGRIAGMNAAKN